MDARILVVDDDPAVRDFLVTLLQSHGRVRAAAGLREALRLAAAEAHDIIFLDVCLPDGVGLEALGAFRRMPGHPEVVIMTGHGDPSGAAAALRHGAWDYLCKPLGVDDVRLAVTRAMELRRSSKEPVRVPFCIPEFVCWSPAMAECMQGAAQAAVSELPVIIHGGTGTGKERLARGIHENSPRASKPFVVVDCTAIPENLVESHLFGHEKGAFTGADHRRVGLVQLAHGGTLFLDEVGDLPLGAQAKFLRVVQEKTLRPLGAKEEVRSDFRLLAATHRNLEAMVQEGRFRQDLYYRMAGLTISVPPLRDRKEDILPLVQEVLRREARRTGGELKGLSPDFLEAVLRYPWPGNVRELVHAVLHALALGGQGPTLYAIHLPESVRVQVTVSRISRKENAHLPRPEDRSEEALAERGLKVFADGSFPTFKEYREEILAQAAKRYLSRLLERCKGDVPQACALSGLSRSRLYALMKQAGVCREENSP